MKNDNGFGKYIVLATGYVYTLAAPVVLMIGIYYIFSKYVFHKDNHFVLIIMILLGIISGYWSLFKEINRK